MKWNEENMWKGLEDGNVEVFIYIIISKIIEILKIEAEDLYFLLSTVYSVFPNSYYIFSSILAKIHQFSFCSTNSLIQVSN